MTDSDALLATILALSDAAVRYGRRVAGIGEVAQDKGE